MLRKSALYLADEKTETRHTPNFGPLNTIAKKGNYFKFSAMLWNTAAVSALVEFFKGANVPSALPSSIL